MRLLVWHGANANAPKSKWGNSPIFEAIFRGGHFRIVKVLLQHGASVHGQSRHNELLMEVAISSAAVGGCSKKPYGF